MSRKPKTDDVEFVQLNFRVEAAVRDAFERICRERDRSMAQVLRAYMRDVVQAVESGEEDGDERE